MGTAALEKQFCALGKAHSNEAQNTEFPQESKAEVGKKKRLARAVGRWIGGGRVHDDVKLSLSEGTEGPFWVEFGFLRLGFPSLLIENVGLV